MDEVLNADEVFLTGTAAEIIGVNKIDNRTTDDGSGGVGPVTIHIGRCSGRTC